MSTIQAGADRRLSLGGPPGHRHCFLLTLLVPNLFPKDELGGVLDEVRAAAKSAGAGETGEQVGKAGAALARLLVRGPFLDARGLMAGKDFFLLFSWPFFRAELL
eukprot:1162101-Pelagomonas_calceolata.AAC.17